jgi:DNA-binding response OmpR family regulator
VPNAQSSPGTTPKAGILLIEEYAALAAAIGSALRKFAPHHATHVARSLTEADALADTHRPELIIIDVDPPWPKLTQLLGKLRTEHPAARALIIGASIPKELLAEQRSHGSLQFLEKPFDVAELGAAVQALLGPWKQSDAESPRASLQSFDAADAVLLQYASGRTVIIEAKKSGGKSGEIHFVDGQLLHAQTASRTGVEALEEIFGWSEPQLREMEKRGSVSRTIPAPWSRAFLEAWRKARAIQPPAPVRATQPDVPTPAPKSPPKTGKKIVVVDDTEMLLIFVEDVLATAHAEFQITTAFNGLSGVKEIERVIPDLVLLDYSLPDFNGDEVCRRLLLNERTARVPVLMMSGHGPEMTRAAEVLDNVVATIEKPFLSEALVAVVEQTLAAGPRPRRKVPSAAQLVEPMPAPAAGPKRPEGPHPKTVPTAAPAKATSGPADQPARRDKGTHGRSQRSAVPNLPVKQGEMSAPFSPPAASPKQVIAPPPAGVPSSAPVVPPATKPPNSLPVFPLQTEMAKPAKPALTSFPVKTSRDDTIVVPVVSKDVNDVVLGLFVDVVSLQLTPELRMGAIRAKPSSLTVSLHVVSPVLRQSVLQTGYQLGRIGLDERGQIATVCLIPTLQPFRPLEIRNAFHIGGLTVMPANSHERLQLTARGDAPMTMQLLAHLEIAGVELSPSFQIAQLVLKSLSSTVRVTLRSQVSGQEDAGATCETTAIRLDQSARIAELLLNPVN